MSLELRMAIFEDDSKSSREIRLIVIASLRFTPGAFLLAWRSSSPAVSKANSRPFRRAPFHRLTQEVLALLSSSSVYCLFRLNYRYKISPALGLRSLPCQVDISL